TVYGVASGAEVSGAALFGLNQAMTRSKKVGSFACASEASSGEATTAQMPTLLRASIFAACDDRRISLRTLVSDLQIRPSDPPSLPSTASHGSLAELCVGHRNASPDCLPHKQGRERALRSVRELISITRVYRPSTHDHRPMLGDYASSCGSWCLYCATGNIPMALSEAIIATYMTIHMARSPGSHSGNCVSLPRVPGGSG